MNASYEITKSLGEGRAGPVYEAFDSSQNLKVVLRRFTVESFVAEAGGWEDKFTETAEKLMAVDHSSVLKVLDYGIDKKGPYLVYEHLMGLSLRSLMRSKGIALERAYDLARQVLEAFLVIERYGFYHYSMSPSSIIAQRSAEGEYRFLLSDLGYSHLVPLLQGYDSSSLSMMMEPAFLAPEMYEGQALGGRTALYSLGQLLYWLIAGGHPLGGMPVDLAYAKHKAGEIPFLGGYRGELPEDFRRWIYWLIQADPNLRPASAGEALRHLPARPEDVPQGPAARVAPAPMKPQGFRAPER